MADLVLIGMLLVLVGFGVMAVAIMRGGRTDGTEVKGGGIVMIGPVPIIFGTDVRWASVAIALAIILIVLTVALSLV